MVETSYEKRVARARKELAAQGLDVLLITDLANIFYLTGFRGSEGALLVSPDEVRLLVDGRYFTQAKHDLEQVKVCLMQEKGSSIAHELREIGAKSVAFEASAVSFSLFQVFKKKSQGIRFDPAGTWLTSLRAVKDESELDLMRKANQIADAVMEEVLPMIRPGVSEQDVATELEYQLKKKGAEGVSFPAAVVSGRRTAHPHAQASRRKFRKGDIGFIDFGCSFEGYQTDQTIPFSLGKPHSFLKKIYRLVKEAQARALEVVRAGSTAQEVDQAARIPIEKAGFGEAFSHSVGHGLGIKVHEYPSLGKTSDARLQTGMVVTVEPGVYLPGRGGVRIEDAVVVQTKGAEFLTKLDKGLRSLPAK